MKPAVSQLCSLNASFEDDVEQYAAGECPAIEVWFTKLEDYLQVRSLDQLRSLLDQHGIVLPVAGMHGGLFVTHEDSRHEAWTLLESRLDLCHRLDIGVAVVACDVGPVSRQQDAERIQTQLARLAEAGRQHQVRIALEFQAGAGLGNNLQTAAALVQHVGSPWLGICLDAFHFHVGPSKSEDLAYLSRENLFHVQLCDLADRPRELAVDGDRILPGDGDLALDGLVRRLVDIGYPGVVSVELMNPRIWQIPARHVAEICITALSRVLASAGP